MKMHRLEKQFVNSDRHSSQVAKQAEQRVRTISPERGQRLLDVGCGNGAAVIHLAHRLGLDVTGVDVDPDHPCRRQGSKRGAKRALRRR